MSLKCEAMELKKQKSFRSKFGNQSGSIRRKISFLQVRQQFEKNLKISENESESVKEVDSPKSHDITAVNRDVFKNVNCKSNNRRNENVNKAIKGFFIIRTDDSYNSEDYSDNKSGNSSKPALNSSKLPILLKPKIPMKLNRKVVNESIEPVSDPNKIKSKISFFEEQTYKTLKLNDSKEDAQKIKVFNNYVTNYGNQDMKVSLNSSDRNSSKAIEKESSTVMTDSNLDIDCTLREKSNTLPNSERNSTISSTSMSSLSSGFASYESESDVVLRKRDKIDNNHLKVIPIPRQRTSLIRNNIEEAFRDSKDNEVNKLCQRVIRTNSRKSLEIKNNTNVKRSSSRVSQDSGIDGVNNSFIWPKSNSTYDEENEAENISQEENSNETTNEEHIYEELCNCRSHHNSLCQNEKDWIDVENDSKKFQIEIIVKKSHTMKQNIFRKSLRPKSHQRKSRIRFSKIKTAMSDNSETEYEDIDDDDSIYSESIYSDNTCIISNPPENTEKQILDQHLSHIYEVLSDTNDNNRQTLQQKNEVTVSPLQTALVKELSEKMIKRKNSWSELEDSNIRKEVVRNSISNQEIERENPYSSTPHRIPKFQSSEKTTNEMNSTNNTVRKRDSQFSRASSIYIDPHVYQLNNTNNFNRKPNDLIDNDRLWIPFSQVRAEIFHKQNSVTGSVASYLEFNGSQETGSPFTSEPLYQFYQKDVRRRAELWIHADPNVTDLDYDIYENNSIYNNNSRNSVCRDRSSLKSTDNCQHNSCRNHISTLDLVGLGPNRSLWCQLPQVINSKSNLLQTLSEGERRLQEAMFEIITSEASYCKSLKILVSHFYNCIELSENKPQVITQREKKSLFSNINEVYKVSSKLLDDLEKRFQHNILLYDVCDILYDYAINQFTPYIYYCAYQRDQEKLLLELKQSRSAFVEILQRLESNQICQNQNLHSFIMLPMQRITRYPLLIDAVCQQLPEKSPIFESSSKALAVLNQLARKCNEETKKVQRMQELIEIDKLLHFRSNIKSHPIVSGARYLVKKGSVIRLSSQISPRKTIGKSTIKWTKSKTFLFLFSDLLILAKKRSENNYSVFDYCLRNTVQLISLDNIGGSIGCNLQMPIPQNYKNLAQLILLHNHEGKSVEHTISFNLESEKLRWIEAVSQPVSDNPNETIYEEWDCPQVQCTRSYSAKQTDELSLEETDVVNVNRKMKDGWFEGERIRDGAKGWFPSDYTEEIVNQHVRARNIRLRYRLLMFTESFIEEQKRTSFSSYI